MNETLLHEYARRALEPAAARKWGAVCALTRQAERLTGPHTATTMLVEWAVGTDALAAPEHRGPTGAPNLAALTQPRTVHSFAYYMWRNSPAIHGSESLTAAHARIDQTIPVLLAKAQQFAQAVHDESDGIDRLLTNHLGLEKHIPSGGASRVIPLTRDPAGREIAFTLFIYTGWFLTAAAAAYRLRLDAHRGGKR